MGAFGQNRVGFPIDVLVHMVVHSIVLFFCFIFCVIVNVMLTYMVFHSIVLFYYLFCVIVNGMLIYVHPSLPFFRINNSWEPEDKEERNLMIKRHFCARYQILTN